LKRKVAAVRKVKDLKKRKWCGNYQEDKEESTNRRKRLTKGFW